jgi:tRNA threonylcarbamoyladenosine biosynthesis protein TsaE
VRDPSAPLERSVIVRTSLGPDETESIAAAIGAMLAAGDVVVLTGDLGAGKTTFVRGLARGLGVTIGVKSPSFAIHLRYPGRIALHHLDLYRLRDARDLAELGLEDVLEQEGVTAVEWGERLGTWLPERALQIRFEDLGGTKRRLHIEGPAALMDRLDMQTEESAS